ncbi:MAG: 16S rRNA (guanine(527)-N(7))-methyltransferase RsmG [Nitrospiraceae bacterium]
MEHREPDEERFSHSLAAGAAQFDLPLSPVLASQCLRYFRELQAWNKKTNLTAITDEREIAIKHFLDSLMCSLALSWSGQARLLDVGSGAGFPGLPLKLMQPELDLILLEPSQKKTAFLRHIIGTLALDRASVIPKRIEELSREPEYRSRFTHIITRAVNMASLSEMFVSLLDRRGIVILCRAKSLEREFPLDNLQIRQEIAYTLPMGYGARVLTILERKSHL